MDEALELGVAHVVVFDGEAVFRSAFVGDVVGGVGEDAVGEFSVEEFAVGGGGCAVSADDAVLSEDPQVSGFRDCCGGGVDVDVVVLFGVGGGFEFLEAPFAYVVSDGVEFYELVCEDVCVPFCELGGAVVGEGVGAGLIVCPVWWASGDFDVCPSEAFRCFDGAVSCDDDVVPDDEGSALPECVEAAGDRVEVFLGMFPRVFGVEGEAADLDFLEFHRDSMIRLTVFGVMPVSRAMPYMLHPSWRRRVTMSRRSAASFLFCSMFAAMRALMSCMRLSSSRSWSVGLRSGLGMLIYPVFADEVVAVFAYDDSDFAGFDVDLCGVIECEVYVGEDSRDVACFHFHAASLLPLMMMVSPSSPRMHGRNVI